MARKTKPVPRRRRPRFATMVCAGLTLAVAVNIAMRDEPGHLPSAAPAGESSDGVASAALDATAPDRELTVAIQHELKAKGYAPGNAEGELTLATRAAVLAFETDIGRPLTGIPSEAILKELLFGATIVAKGLEAPKLTAEGLEARPRDRGPPAKRRLRPRHGRWQARHATAKAIKRFEAANGLKQTGRIGGKMAGRLGEG